MQWIRHVVRAGAAALLIVGLTPGAARAADAADSAKAELEALTAESAYTRLKSYRDAPSTEYLDRALALFRESAKANPKDARWALGQALALRGKGERAAARDLAASAAKLDPTLALAHMWHGTLIFETINDAGLFEKMSLASTGKSALDKAVELDPALVDARMGLFQFYANAPGIAGGSTKKAREQAQAMTALEGGKYMGHLCLARLAAKEEKWSDVASAIAAAEQAASTPEEARGAVTTHANLMLTEKKDPAAALALLERAAGMPHAKAESDITIDYMRGEAYRAQKNFAKAREHYAVVIGRKPEAQNSRYYLAESLEKLGEFGEAAGHYEEFVSRFPKDDRAKKAADTAKRLRKKVKP